jgi:hypothetical protein
VKRQRETEERVLFICKKLCDGFVYIVRGILKTYNIMSHVITGGVEAQQASIVIRAMAKI